MYYWHYTLIFKITFICQIRVDVRRVEKNWMTRGIVIVVCLEQEHHIDDLRGYF